MAIKAVIFDCFGVLVIAGHALLDRNYPQFVSDIEKLKLLSDSDEISRLEFNQTIAKLIGLTPEQVDERYWGNTKCVQPMIDFVKELKNSSKCKIGLLSNVNRDWMDKILPVFNEENLFDAMVLSGDVHLVKPDPKIFKLMAIKLGVEPEECIMIDDLEINIFGAERTGMKGIVHISLEQTRLEIDQLLKQNNA